MKISIGSDHAGFELKEALKGFLSENGHEVLDCGAFSLDSVDYADFALPTAKKVASGECQFGIVVCFTGIGVSIVANKVKNIRCALCGNVDMAELTRRHNDSNMLALGAKYTDFDLAKQITERFLTTPFDGGRHLKRIEKISDIER